MQQVVPVTPFHYFNIIISYLIIIFLINFQKSNFPNFGQRTLHTVTIFSRFSQSISPHCVTKNRIMLSQFTVASFLIQHLLLNPTTENWSRGHWQQYEIHIYSNTVLLFVIGDAGVFQSWHIYVDISDIFRRMFLEHRGRAFRFLSLSQTFIRVYFIERHRTNCCEYYWQPSDEGHSRTAVCI